MGTEHSIESEFSEAPQHVSEFRRFCKVFFGRKIVVLGLIVILLLITTAIFAPWIAPYDPYKQYLKEALMQPCAKHLLGTDSLGRDTLSRIIYGSRTSLMVGIVALFIAASIGVTLGLLAGYFGGAVNMLIMRFTDALMSFPMIVKALVITAVLGGGLRNIMIALGIGLIPAYVRLMCGQVLSIMENDYIIASRATGSGNLRVMLVHVLPNAFPPIMVLITLMMGATILNEASLSFLGMGIKPPRCAWGSMINDGYQYLLTQPVLSFAPGFAIMLVVFSFNMIGDGLRDALDPKLRGSI